ncbi:glycoside hydrolase family 127 protein [Lepagella muris]|uniref:Glycoside hydrolase family 127 protein n=2 Tax=Lepagella muris TaxID=3032870 RepID=A0AC61RFR7_9BACT|nr:glycoside hydrolase family 127 protein [Lepagella muris]THG52678.1 glycoside hydrolase family 127 protein [Bacteroidales bacterium]
MLLPGCAALVGFTACTGAEAYERPDAPVKEVAFTQVHIDDSFWAPRIETNRKVSIPSAFNECEKNGRFDNFAIAGGLKKGEHRGDFSFDDTDPYKIIEGASYSLAVEYDKQLDNYLDSVINLIAAAQEPDGYLTTCVTNKCTRLSGWWGTHRWEKINSHELYNSGHLYEAAVAHYLATGKRSLLDVAIKNADLVCKTFGYGEGQIQYPSGHPIIEMALAKLYKVTGDKKYLDEAKYFVEETGRLSNGRKPSPYSQDHQPILEQEEIVGHAVRAGYLYSGVADVASLTNDSAYFNALTRIWDNMASKKLYITGGIGSRAQGEGFGPNYELKNHTAYCETCASIANVYWNYRMFLATGDAKYADVYERALYNGVPSGVSLSGDKFFYDNPLESMGQHERQPWFGCACCPGNVTRFMASVPQYMYATQGDDVLVNLYIQSTADIKTDGNSVKLRQTTDFPWNGAVSMDVDPETEGEFALRLRIPGWAQDAPVPTDLYSYVEKPSAKYELKVNGEKVNAMTGDGYATVKRVWKKGDKVELTLPMDVKRVKANDNVDDDKGKLAIQRGPLMYCFEGQDQKDSLVLDKYIPTDVKFAEKFEPQLLNGVMTLSVTGKKLLADNKLEDVTLTAIPYCTWNNRGADQMAVWMPTQATYAVAKPEPSLASGAQMYSEPTELTSDAPAATSNLNWAWGYNDQWEPKSSADTSKPYHYWWLRQGTTENVCYRFNEPKEVSSVDVYWLAFNHYDGDYETPESWQLYYRTPDNRWAPVKTADTYGVEKDKYNHVSFEPVTTTDLKVSAKLRDGKSGGVIEWKVN